MKAALDRFWNPKGYYNYGLYSNGSYTSSLLTLETFPIWLGVTDPEKARLTCEWYSGDNFTKPWGVRQSGDPRDEDFCFCGKKVRAGQTYCDEHSAMAYVKANRR